MRRQTKLVDWELIERLLHEFGGIADDPVAAADIERLKAGKAAGGISSDQRRCLANISGPT